MSLYPPGPTDWRRTIEEIRADPIGFRLRLQQTYGDFVYYRHGPAYVYFINDPDLIREVLMQQSQKMARVRVAQESLTPFLGQGLLVSSGEHHRSQRKAIQPIFTPTWIASYFEVMAQCIDELTADWVTGQDRNIGQDMMRFASTVIYRTVFGANPNRAQVEVRAAIDTLQKFSNQVMRGGSAIQKVEVKSAIEQLDAAVKDLIQQHETSAAGSDLLSHLLALRTLDGSRMPEKQVRDEVVTMLVAGHETTGNALTWLFYLLAQHPQVQTQIRQEMWNTNSKSLSIPDYLTVLPFAEQVLKETLRLYPPAWLIGRSPTESVMLGGYSISPGATILICPYVLHRNATVFPDPEQYMPQRFSTEPPAYSYLPFGAGPHVCIGQSLAMQEMMLTVTRLLDHWRFELVDTHPPEMEALITLRPRNTIQLRIHNIEDDKRE